MWKNFQREYEVDVQHISKVSTRVTQKRTAMFVNALVKTFPTLSSDLLKCIDDFNSTCTRAKFSKVVLGQGNADWLAISLVSGATSSPIAQKLLVDMLKEGVLLDNTAVKERKDRVTEAYLPCHVVTYGQVTSVEKLFRECIKLASVLDTKVMTSDGIYELDQRLSQEIEVHLVKFPKGVQCPTFRKTHNLNFNKPKKHDDGHYLADLTRVFSVQNNGRLLVDMSFYTDQPHFMACRFYIPVNVVQDGYVLSYALVIAELQCHVYSTTSPVVKIIPSSCGNLAVLPWLEYCKLLTVSRRGASAMAIVSVFVFYHLWDTLDAKRLREIMVMLRSRQSNEVTNCLIGALMSFGMEHKEWRGE